MLGQIAKGSYKEGETIETLKPEFIRKMIQSWPDESTIVWCVSIQPRASTNDAKQVLPGAASIRGETPIADRLKMIADFQAGPRQDADFHSRMSWLWIESAKGIAARFQRHSGFIRRFLPVHQAVQSRRFDAAAECPRPSDVHRAADGRDGVCQVAAECRGHASSGKSIQGNVFGRGATFPLTLNKYKRILTSMKTTTTRKLLWNNAKRVRQFKLTAKLNG